MKKPVYKLLDEKGRILIPKEFRQMAELESGDIDRLNRVCGVRHGCGAWVLFSQRIAWLRFRA